MDVPVNAEVECTDGVCGQATHLIVNATTGKLTHLVVKEISADNVERLVPLGKVKTSTFNLVHLNCDRAELATMQEFVEHQSFHVTVPNYNYLGPYIHAAPERRLVTVETPHLGSGEVAIDRQTRVEATDGHLGHLVELSVEPATGTVWQLVVRAGALWKAHDVPISVARVALVEPGAISLAIDKHLRQASPVGRDDNKARVMESGGHSAGR